MTKIEIWYINQTTRTKFKLILDKRPMNIPGVSR